MGSVVLPHLPTAWHVDQAILSEEERYALPKPFSFELCLHTNSSFRLVVIRFGRDHDPDCKYFPQDYVGPDRG